MQPLGGGLQPSPEAVVGPVLGAHQDDPGTLDEERAQMPVAALRDAAEDGAVAGRHLPRHETEPSREVAPAPECRSVADRRRHGARRQRPDAGNAHQPLASLVAGGQGLDLGRQIVDTGIEMPPVTAQALDHADHSSRQRIVRLRQDLRQRPAQSLRTLTDRNAALQQERPDLIDHACALTHQAAARPVQRLQVELLDGLGRHEPHRRTLHRLGNRLGVTEIVLLAFQIRLHIKRRHQPRLVAERS